MGQHGTTFHVGPYPVTAVIGSGGFGTVYLGTDPVTGSRVAVKVLDRGASADPQWRGQLRAEAEAMRRIDDQHCVRVIDVVDEPDVAAIVTDFIDGASLRMVLARVGRLTGPQALDILRGALLGLEAVHRSGLLHGDLKPDNVLIDRGGVSRLIDFGLAAAPRSVDLGTAPLVGSPSYLSPEQIRGEPTDVRSDIYACATMLFELLCGRRPYVADSFRAVLSMHLAAPVPDPRTIDPTISDAFARLCVAGLAKDPAQRPQTALEFRAALEDAARERYGAAWRSGLAIGAVVGGSLAVGADHFRAVDYPRVTRSRRRRGIRVATVGGTAAVVIAGVALTLTLTLTHRRSHAASTPTVTGLAGHFVVTRSVNRQPQARPTYEVLGPSGTVIREIPSGPGLCCYGPALSPDGTKLLLEGEGALEVARADGTGVRTIWTSGLLSVGAASWSPNGTKIAFSATDNSTTVPTSVVDVINADGSALHAVAEATMVHSIAWAPDGTHLAFLQNQGGVWVVAESGGELRDILDPARTPGLLPTSLSWAPARSVLVDEIGAAPNGVWAVAPDGSGLHSLLPAATSPSWAPDGKHFAAVVNGRVVIVSPNGAVEETIGPSGVSGVQRVGSG